MSTTPLTDAINALTQYANETTGASDTTLSDAVGTLVAGYGGGGGAPTSSFVLKDYKVTTSKWVIDSGIANLIKDGGCLHIKMTIPTTPQSTTDAEFISVGGDALTSWSPSTNCSMFGFIGYVGGRNYCRLRLRGSTLNGVFDLNDKSDENGNVDLKLYSNRYVNVLTGTTIYYANDSSCTDVATAMTNLCALNYISIGSNQSNVRWSGHIIDLWAIEAE